MFRIILVSFLLFFTFLVCQKDNAVNTYNYKKDAPVWLKEKIDSISTIKYYTGTKVYRYELDNKFIYYFRIPLSSCEYCEVYYQDGSKMNFTNNDVRLDFQNNKKNEVLVWEWKQ